MTTTDPATLHEEFAAAIRRRDVDALLAFCEEGAVQLRDDGSISDDRAALRELFRDLVSRPGLPDVPQRLTVSRDDLALTSTSYVFAGPDATVTMTTAGSLDVSPTGPGWWRSTRRRSSWTGASATSDSS